MEYTPAFPQVEIEFPMHMKLLVGLKIKEEYNLTRVLKLKKRYTDKNKEIESNSSIYDVVKYLIKTKNKDIILKPDRSKSLEVFADTDFPCNWNTNTAPDDVSTTKYRTSFLI